MTGDLSFENCPAPGIRRQLGRTGGDARRYIVELGAVCNEQIDVVTGVLARPLRTMLTIPDVPEIRVSPQAAALSE